MSNLTLAKGWWSQLVWGCLEYGLSTRRTVVIAELAPVFLLNDELAGTKIESNDSLQRKQLYLL